MNRSSTTNTTSVDPYQSRRRQRIAWGFLLGSFAVFFVLLAAVPLGVNAFIQNASRPLTTSLQANQGTVGINDKSGVRLALLQGEPPQNVEAGSTILTNVTATALMFVSPPDDAEQLLARVQLYSNTVIELDRAEAPRFSLSDRPQLVDLFVENGRLRVAIPPTEERPFALTVDTPHGTALFREAGQYSLEVNDDETQVAVQEGTASVVAAGQALEVAADQRARVMAGGPPQGPLATERNLIANGDFSRQLDRWAQFAWRIELPDQPAGETEVVDVAGDPSLRFARQGQGHADARIRQTINQDVTDFETLRLNMTFRVLEQSLPVCGRVGSECPLFVQVTYIDENSAEQIWQHGFYATGTVDDNIAPDACVSCAVVQSAHGAVSLNSYFFYDVDLRVALAQQGVLPPGFIKSISLVSSGHSFVVEVLDVALIAEE